MGSGENLYTLTDPNGVVVLEDGVGDWSRDNGPAEGEQFNKCEDQIELVNYLIKNNLKNKKFIILKQNMLLVMLFICYQMTYLELVS